MSESTAPSLDQRVNAALDACRPYLHKDGGDIELISIGGDGVVELRFSGACVCCPLSRMTLRAGIERMIMKYAPEIRRVEQV